MLAGFDRMEVLRETSLGPAGVATGFLVRAHARFSGSMPSGRAFGRQLMDVSLTDVFLFPSLPLSKIDKNTLQKNSWGTSSLGRKWRVLKAVPVTVLGPSKHPCPVCMGPAGGWRGRYQ